MYSAVVAVAIFCCSAAQMPQGWYTDGCCCCVGLGGSGSPPWRGLLTLTPDTTLGCSPPYRATVATVTTPVLWPGPNVAPPTRGALAPRPGPWVWPCCRRRAWATAPCRSMRPWATAPWRGSTLGLVPTPCVLVAAVALIGLARSGMAGAMLASIAASGPMPP